MSDAAENSPTLHLIKLSVGTESVEGLCDWQTSRSAARRADGLDPRPRHITRMWPRREEELLKGGSIYWVINGAVQARQRIDELEEVIGEDGIRRCAIILIPELIRTRQRPRRPFQGWRYLDQTDAPPDMGPREAEDQLLPDELRDALTRFGVLGS